ncbi:YjzD family protein [Furfurilactobacillus sp. WILCCON 0119]|uniref:YjzD family protein n=1 Tax=Furfurilactobacillus entadae TaxID=2922307 RepID=UPI0035E80C7C
MRYLTVIFWGFIWGEVIGYIGGQLELMTYKPLEVGIVAAIVCLVVSVCTVLLADKPAPVDANK